MTAFGQMRQTPKSVQKPPNMKSGKTKYGKSGCEKLFLEAFTAQTRKREENWRSEEVEAIAVTPAAVQRLADQMTPSTPSKKVTNKCANETIRFGRISTIGEQLLDAVILFALKCMLPIMARKPQTKHHNPDRACVPLHENPSV